tara:strand:+ start:266 stop:1252 length:987 start_codon:yes stop_codon:yes gene_type:complete
MSIFANNILVTGGAGYIGSHIVELLIKNNSKVFIFDNLVTGYKKLINKKAKFIRGDIKNLGKLSKTIKNNNINSVIHLAAYINIKDSEKYKKKYYKNNVGGTLNLLKACKGTSVKNIIFSSSCSIYGNIKGPVNEKKKPNPKSYYAFTKYKGEEIIKRYSKKFNFQYGILRYFNVAGASKSGKIGEIEKSHGHLIKNLATQSTKLNPKVYIFGNNYNTKDGTCIRDYIHVSDLAELHIVALKNIIYKKKSLILNCGYGKGYSVKEIVDIFKKIKKNVIVRYQSKRHGDVAQIYANISKLRKTLNWKPKYSNIKLILKSAIKWEKKLLQ